MTIMESPIIARTRGIARARTAFGALIFALARRRLKKLPVPMRIMAMRPPLLRGGALMELSQESATLVPLRYKKLAQLLTATRIGCPF
jgi:hypothetical protein